MHPRANGGCNCKATRGFSATDPGHLYPVRTAGYYPGPIYLGHGTVLANVAQGSGSPRRSNHFKYRGDCNDVHRIIYLPLADAVAIVFVMPFFLLILGKIALGEQVGLRRLLACIVGFVGTLMVIKPSFAEVGLPALLPVCVAAIFSIFILVTRQIAKEADPIAQQAVSGLMAIAMPAPLLVLGGMLDAALISPIQPTTSQWTLLLGLGIVGTFAHLFMTWSLRYAPSATLAPMQYLEIPFATILGFLIFNDLPDGIAAVGIAIIVLSGLYVIAREQAIARTLAPSSK